MVLDLGLAALQGRLDCSCVPPVCQRLPSHEPSKIRSTSTTNTEISAQTPARTQTFHIAEVFYICGKDNGNFCNDIHDHHIQTSSLSPRSPPRDSFVPQASSSDRKSTRLNS